MAFDLSNQADQRTVLAETGNPDLGNEDQATLNRVRAALSEAIAELETGWNRLNPILNGSAHRHDIQVLGNAVPLTPGVHPSNLGVVTNRERVLALIRDEPGLTDREIHDRTGISPHQQVNQICRMLAAEGLVERVRGPNGRIINIPPDKRPRDPDSSSDAPPTPTRQHHGRTQVAATRTRVGSLDSWSPARMLLVLPCSGSKHTGGDSDKGTSILDVLPENLAAELSRQRRRNAIVAGIDESTLMPASGRYDGTLFRSAGTAVLDLQGQGARVAIISGGYGLVLAEEPIGTYEQVFRPAMWPDRIIERCLATLAAAPGVASVVGVLSSTTGYATVFRRVPWPTGTHVMLASPEPAPGAMVKSPRAQGEWLAASVRAGGAPEGWRSSDGLRMRTVQL